MMLVDSHCHLDFPDFSDTLPDVVSRARSAGVSTLLTICTHLSRFDGVRAVAERFDSVWCSVGIHPHESGHECLEDAETLLRLADHPKVVAFGETGLDYHYEHSPRDDQKKAFRLHMKAARQSGLPVIIHTRDAEEDTATLLRHEMDAGPFPGVLHCFSSSYELGKIAVDLGLYISLSGIITFRKADALREAVRALPLDRMLVETDSPYLAPVPMRGQCNEPSFTVLTARKLAEIKGISEDEVARITTENFFRLFSKVKHPGSV